MVRSSTVSPPCEPGWLHWQPLSPLVAGATLWFLGRVWHHQFPWPVWAALVLSAWACRLGSHWSQGAPGQERARPLLVGAGLGLIAVSIALRWLPQGLVLAAVPVAGLAVFQALMSLGNTTLWARRLAVAGACLGAIGIAATAPSHWPGGLRLGLIGLAVILSWSMWKGGHKLAIAEAPLVLARGFVFAAGLLLPVAWWMPGGLIGELARPENLVFALLAIVAAACRSEWRKLTPSPRRLTAFAVAALMLTAASGFGAWTIPAGPVRGVFFGVGATAFLLTAGLGLSLRRPIAPVFQKLVPDLAWAGLVLMALWPPPSL